MKILNKIPLALLAFCLTGIIAPMAVSAAGPAPINLGSAGNFAVLAKTGVSTTGTTNVTGDIGVSPAAATYITGFALNLPATSAFATSPIVVGKVYAPSYANPTSADLTAAVSNMEAAYTDGAGRTNPTATELAAGNIGGLTLAPGLYKWGTSLAIPTSITLAGGASDVWIFQIAQNLNVSSAVTVVLSGGAQPSNVFWIVGGQVTIGTTAAFVGNILGQTAIVLQTGAKLNGRALAQSAVTLDASSVTMPSYSYSPPSVVTTPVTSPVYTNPVYTQTTVSSSPNNVAVNSNTVVTTAAPAIQQTYQSGQSMPALGTSAYSGAALNNSSPSMSSSGEQIRTIYADLDQGSRGSDVTVLQQFLISQNIGPASRSLGAVGATSYFGVLTQAALAEFQANAGIKPPQGYFGPITRGYINARY